MGLIAFLFLLLPLLCACTSSTVFDDIRNRSVTRDKCEDDFDCQSYQNSKKRCLDGVCKEEVICRHNGDSCLKDRSQCCTSDECPFIDPQLVICACNPSGDFLCLRKGN